MTDDSQERAEPSEGATDELIRRSFFAKLSLALSAMIGAMMVLPGVGYILAPILSNPPRRWRAVGPVDQFKPGSTVLVHIEDSSSVPWAGVSARTGAWLRRVEGENFIAFSINCRHLGCPVRWVEDADLFMCPCHGGVYYRDGTVAAGPPPKPLARLQVQVNKGQVEIATASVPLTTTKV